MSDTTMRALELIAATHNELAAGTKHYALDGTPLLTVRAVIEALTKDGSVELVPSANRA